MDQAACERTARSRAGVTWRARSSGSTGGQVQLRGSYWWWWCVCGTCTACENNKILEHAAHMLEPCIRGTVLLS